MGSNRIVLILIFIGIGYFLLYQDSEGPMSKFTDSLKNVFSTEKSQETENPYKAKEKPTFKGEEILDDAKDVITQKVEETTSDFLNEFKEKIFGKSDSVNNDLPAEYFPVSKKKLEVVNHKAYALGYDEDHEQSAWAFHVLTKAFTYGEASRRGVSFKPDDKVSTSSALATDFTRTGYDRGHLVPSGDFKCCQDLMEDTFWVSNLIPQDPDCNRHTWNNLEQQTRNWSRKKNRLYVFTGPILEPGLKKIGQYNRISVPERLYKVIFFLDESNIENSQVKAFLLPNKSELGPNFNLFKASVDEIEQASGLDFLAPLPDALEKRLEETISTSKW
jgi:endonuclease G